MSCLNSWSQKVHVLRLTQIGEHLKPRCQLFHHSVLLILFLEGRNQLCRKKSVVCLINKGVLERSVGRPTEVA